MKVFILLFAAFAILLSLSLAISARMSEENVIPEDENNPVVNITTGLFRGGWQHSRCGKKFASFEGMPYAKKADRFQAPEPLDDWKEYDATHPGSICAQFDLAGTPFVEENCLFLNIFVPEKLPEYPVTMVWVHGGGFTFGSGSEMGPAYILDEDVILVTFNYRLGVFGFLSSSNPIASGNCGYKDMILALKWVKANVGAFGGDPDHVIIFGESAGGAAVHSLMISPAIKGQGLFTKVIAQSGSALAKWSTLSDAETSFRGLANDLSCNGTDTEIIDCLRQKDAVEILQAGSNYVFPVVIDANPAPGDYSVFPEPMENLAPHADPLTLIIGRTECELFAAATAIVRSDVSWIDNFNHNWRDVLPPLLQFGPLVWQNDTEDRISDAIRSFYFHDRDIPNEVEGTAMLERVLTDFFYNWHVRKSAVIAARAGSPTFPYLFRFNGSFSLAHWQSIHTDCPIHADDLQYLFPSLQPWPYWPEQSPGSRDEKFSQHLIKLWCTFAKTGVPHLAEYGPAWAPINREEVADSENVPLKWYILYERGDLVEESEDLRARAVFWNNVFDPSKNWACVDCRTD